jgi:L-ascorbate metabolism protein UlaG (beta-lactamase superfamily)
MQIRFLGHASVRIDLDGLGFLTDPALQARIGPLRRIAGPIEPRWLEGLDAVLVSHLHLDHLDLPSLQRIPPEVLVIAPAGAAAWLRAQGRPNVVELAPGESTDVGGIRIRAVPARHGGFRSPRGPRAIAVGYLIEGRRTVYFAGDTGLFDGLAALAGDVDVALLPVAGWGPTLPARTHLNPVRAARAAGLIGASTVVPIHWGTYRPLGLRWAMRADPRQPAEVLVRAASKLAPGSTIVPLDIGATIALP